MPTPVVPGVEGAAAALAGLGDRLPRQGESTPRVARELETVFLSQLLQVMRKTVPENDYLPKSAERDVYDGLFDRTIAESMSASDPLGFERALKVRNEAADTVPGMEERPSQGGLR